MKNRKFLTKLFVTTGLALVSSSMLFSIFNGTSIAETFADLGDATPVHHNTDWIRLNINPEKVSPEGETSFDDYNFTLELSPQPKDYKSARPDDLKTILNEMMNGLQDIVSSQIKFISSHRNVPPRDEIQGVSINSPVIFRHIIDGILREKVFELEAEYFDPIPAVVQQFSYGNSEPDLNTNEGTFLVDLLSVFAAYNEEGKYSESEIMERVGVMRGDNDKIVPIPSSLQSANSMFTTFKKVYEDLAELQNNEADKANAENYANMAILNVYKKAIALPEDKNLTPEQFVILIGAFDKTYLELNYLIDIFGRDLLTEKAKEVFANKDVGVQYPQFLLNYCDETILNDLFDKIQQSYVDHGEKGIDDEYVVTVMDLAGPTRIFDICTNITSKGWLNLSIFMGKGIDFSKGYWHIDEDTGEIIKGERGDAQSYAEVGAEMVSNFMNDLSVEAALTGIQQVSFDYKGTEYLILEKPVNDFGKMSNTLEIRTHNLVDLLNALPKMEELRDRNDSDMHEDFTIKLITSINDREQEIDEEGYVVSFGELKPVEIHARIGFMPEKDCKYVRKLAAILDDTFDLEFGFSDEEDLWVDLKTYNPNFVSNIYAWLCDSGVIRNDTDIKFLNEIWDHAFSTIGEIKQWILSKDAEVLVEDLKNINYEVALATITSADELNEILNISRISDSMIDKALEYFRKAVDKGMTLTYEDFLDAVEKINGTAADKLDNDKLRQLYDKLQTLLEKIHDKHVDVDMLLSIRNESVYKYVEKLTGKADLIMKARDYLLKAINRLPEEAMNFSLMDIYVGNGEFKGNGSVKINYDQISSLARKVPQVSNAWTTIDGMLVGEDRPVSFSWNIDSMFDDIYSVTYEWTKDGEAKSKSGILHKGSDVRLFSGLEEDDGGSIIHWLDKNKTFKRVDDMVDYDVVVIPEHMFNIDITKVDKTYDGEESYLTATVDGDFVDFYTLSYKWEKYNEETGEFETLSGAISSKYAVKNHKDSGTYRVVVENGFGESLTKETTVNIKKAQIELKDEWLYSDVIPYDGREHTIYYDETKIPSGAALKEYIGNKATDVGPYTATAIFKLTDADNYEFKDGIDRVSKDWEIKDLKIHISPKFFEEPYEYLFDETSHNPLIDPDTYDHDKVELIGYQTKRVGEDDSAYIDGGRTEIGEYVVRPIFKSLIPGLTVDPENIPTKVFYIYRVVDASALEWSKHDTFTYNGSEHSVYVKNYESIAEIDYIEYETKYNVDGVEAVADGNTRVDAASYKTKATPVFKDGYTENTIKFEPNSVFGAENAKNWIISPAVIEVKQVTWDYCYNDDGHSPFVYEKDHSWGVDLVPGFLPEQVDYRFVEGSEHNEENAGNYTAKIEIFIKPEFANNYVLVGNKEYQCNWTILPKVIGLNNIVWSDEVNSLTYTGDSLTTKITSIDYADLLKISEYKGNTNINAGTYTAVAFVELTDSSGNYVLDEHIIVHDYTINKAEISVSDIVWNYNSANPYVEDGSEKSVYIESFTNSEFVDVTYINEDFANTAVNPGEYEAKAVFTLKEEYKDNYVLVGENTAFLYWKIVAKEVNNYNFFTSVEVDAENKPLATVLVDNYIHENPTLTANASDGAMFEGKDINFEALIGGKGEIKYSYDLAFEYEGEVYNFEENVFTINVLIPEEIRDEEFAIVVINNDNSVSKIDFEIKGNYVEIHGDLTQKIGFVTKIPHSKALADNPQNLLLILFAGVGQLIFVIATIIGAKKLRKNREKNN